MAEPGNFPEISVCTKDARELPHHVSHKPRMGCARRVIQMFVDQIEGFCLA
jgi:hypothetical protein